MGKTKDITVNNDGTCTFLFKDDACGEDGVFDPGANQVGLKIDGIGRASLLLTQHFFQILKEKGVTTHFISADIEKGTMTCKHLDILPVEFIWRSKAWGSFCKMYGVEQGRVLNGLVEATLKDDSLGDPRINEEACIALGKLTKSQYDWCDAATRAIGKTLAEEMKKHDYELIDFKVEFGLDKEGNIMLADELSGGIWRLLGKDGKTVDPVECVRKICGEYY
jgi:phosphoribosylaminoimidazole-succinocarboxamide synthase